MREIYCKVNETPGKTPHQELIEKIVEILEKSKGIWNYGHTAKEILGAVENAGYTLPKL